MQQASTSFGASGFGGNATGGNAAFGSMGFASASQQAPGNNRGAGFGSLPQGPAPPQQSSFAAHARVGSGSFAALGGGVGGASAQTFGNPNPAFTSHRG